MKTPFFTAEDFLIPELNPDQQIARHTRQMTANLANAKLEREGKRVYGLVQLGKANTFSEASDNPQCNTPIEQGKTHTALLIQIEEIEK